jgi:hypothetical protein
MRPRRSMPSAYVISSNGDEQSHWLRRTLLGPWLLGGILRVAAIADELAAQAILRFTPYHQILPKLACVSKLSHSNP